ncbi:MAG: AzlD domain-containing protein [Bacillota bacterium]
MEQLFIPILVMSFVTYLPRVMPVLLLSRRNLPAPLVSWLSYIPVTVLAALLGPVLLTPGGKLELLPAQNQVLWVSVPVFLVAYFTRNLFATVLSGMGLIALWRCLF